MPKALLDYLGYVIYFWIGDGHEPVHVHVAKGKPTESATKIWIKASGVELAHNDSNIPKNDLKQLIRFISENRTRITERWLAHFGHAEYKQN